MEVWAKEALKLRFRKLAYFTVAERERYEAARKRRNMQYLKDYRSYLQNSMYENYMIEKNKEDIESLVELEREGLQCDLLIEMINIDKLVIEFGESLSELEYAFVLKIVQEEKEADYRASLSKVGAKLLHGAVVMFRGNSYTKVGNELLPSGKKIYHIINLINLIKTVEIKLKYN
jgi:hypothetical protein